MIGPRLFQAALKGGAHGALGGRSKVAQPVAYPSRRRPRRRPAGCRPGTWASFAAAGVDPAYMAAAMGGLLYVGFSSPDTFKSFNPATSTWTTLATPTGVIFETSVLYPDGAGGLIYVNEGGASVERYSIAGDSWASLSAAGAPQSNCAYALHNGIIYVFGGGSAGSEVATVLTYAIATDTWSTAASMPQTFAYGAAVEDGGRIYVFGGQRTVGVQSASFVYDPALGSWSTLGALPPLWMAVTNLAVALGDGCILYGGGYLQTGVNPDPVPFWLYNTARDTYTEAPFPDQGFGDTALCGALLDGVVYTLGTFDGGDERAFTP